MYYTDCQEQLLSWQAQLYVHRRIDTQTMEWHLHARLTNLELFAEHSQQQQPLSWNHHNLDLGTICSGVPLPPLAHGED